MTASLATPTIAHIQGTHLSPLVLRFIERYEAVAERHRFLWKWAAHGIAQTTLSSVPAADRPALLDTKLLGVILNVLLDDLADQRGDAGLLERALAIPLRPPGADPLAGVPAADRPYFRCIAAVWDALWTRTQALPGFARYRELLVFDYRQVFNCMRYGLLLKQAPALVNAAENGLYQPHNMNMMVFATLDLMASPGVPAAELGRIRDAVTHAQRMGQTSNMIVTWQREVPDRDFSSRIFALALQRSVLTAAELDTLPEAEIVARIQGAGLEAALLAEWTASLAHLHRLAPTVGAVDLRALCDGLQALLDMTLASRGRL